MSKSISQLYKKSYANLAALCASYDLTEQEYNRVRIQFNALTTGTNAKPASYALHYIEAHLIVCCADSKIGYIHEPFYGSTKG